MKGTERGGEQHIPGWVQQHGARLARQSLLNRDQPARFTFSVHESALRLPVGGPTVMLDQLEHLLRMSRRYFRTLRVVPATLGAHAGMAGAFRLMEFADFRPVVYLENENSSMFLELPAEVEAYRRILTALAEMALDEEESRKLIATLATEFYADRKDHDDGTIGWRTSSYSYDSGNCVEVAPGPDAVLVRDSKNRPALTVPPTWQAFLTTLPH